jgi:glycosyltransferase involved in cell wall biosynthesis
MKVLHVSNSDLLGRGFAGYDLLAALAPKGVTGKQAVLHKTSDNPGVIALLNGPDEQRLLGSICAVEARHSMHDLLHPWGRTLAQDSAFVEADLVHYHLINNRVVSLLDMPWLTGLKPSVWSIHDPWAFTGHCIYPRDCERWVTGCETCPHLDYPYPMKEDRAGRMYRVKKDVYARMQADVILASEYMLDMALRSPLMAQFDHLHRIPYGVDRNRYLPEAERAQSRRILGIPQDDFVIAFRSTTAGLKGLPEILDALSSERPARRSTLLTMDTRHLVHGLSRAYNIVDLGWVDDPVLHARFLSACDIFLMPSTGEAFGLMAVEAMAAGRPVICFEGTSLPEVTFAPECGIAVPMGDSIALRAAIDRLAADPTESRRRGQLGRELVAEHYDQDTVSDALLAVYEGVIERRRLRLINRS